MPLARPKILVVTPWYPHRENPYLGMFVRDMNRAAAQFADVTVLFVLGCDLAMKEPWKLVLEQDQSLTAGLPTYNFCYKRSWPVTSAASVLRTVHACRQIASTFQPDIIHAHVHRVALQAIFAGRSLGVPVVITEHATSFPRKTLSRREVFKARYTFRRADLVLPVSQALQNAIIDYGIKAEFRLIPNTVDTQMFHPALQDHPQRQVKQMICICHLDVSPKKGLHHLFAALARLRSIRQDWQMNLVGDGEGREKYVEMVRKLNLTDKVTFHGAKLKGDVAKMLQQMDLLVLPSLFETFSLATAEALASGLPVVVTRCGGPETFVTDLDGLTVQPGDEQALSAAMDKMLNTCHRYPPLELASRIDQKFGLQAVSRQLQQAYQQVLAKRQANLVK